MGPKRHLKFSEGGGKETPSTDVSRSPVSQWKTTSPKSKKPQLGKSSPHQMPGPVSFARLKAIQDEAMELTDNDRRFLSSESPETASDGEEKFAKIVKGTQKGKVNSSRRSPKVVNFKHSDESDTDSESSSEDTADETPQIRIQNQNHLKDQQRRLLHERRNLPIYQNKDKVIQYILNSQVTVLLGETGSGKSTQLPQFIYDLNPKVETIAITQPRRVAAINLATRVSEEMGTGLGDKVGYSVRFQNKTSPNTKIKFLTEGMLLREYMLDPKLKRYSTIILDEAHERTVTTDLLMGLVKELLPSRPKLRILIMSATLDAEKFSKFFNDAPIIYVEGKLFPVQRYYLRQPVDDIVDSMVQCVCQVNLSEPSGDILCFLPGQEEIEKCVDRVALIGPQLPKEAPIMAPLPLYASLPPSQQQRAFLKFPPRKRKIIFATNIAETSLTIPGVRYVVDSGLRKIKVWKPELGLDTLLTTAVSQASASQRMGRAGREGPGKCYRLFTEDTYSTLVTQTEPEILRTDISHTILTLKKAGIENVVDFNWLHSPGKTAIANSLVRLYGLKALGDSGEITELGEQMVLLPISPHLACVLIHAKEDGSNSLLSSVLDIVSCLSVEELLVNPHPDLRDEVNERRNTSFGGGKQYGDLIMLKEMYDMYRSISNKRARKDWCKSVAVNFKAMRNVEQVRSQLEGYLQVKSEPTTRYDARNILKCFLHGFVTNTALGLPDRRYKTIINGQNISVHPSSMLFGQKHEAIMYAEYVYTSKGYARTVSPIDYDWLGEIAPHLLGRRNATEA
jgi:ATP-dependent RNA helicase DHR2